MARTRYLCIHGHFYQPPRENPWLDEIERQESAAPFHDWNERITEECYRPNAAARVLSAERRIVEIADNYRSISFNFGPTLLSWMQRRAPELHESIRAADRASLAARGGHGNAIAQAYNHAILPLASRRDKITQVRWGLADFERRFGRRSEGLWLAETAVDTESLEVLAAHGVRYTILSPYQARAVRPEGATAWTDALGGRLDPTRPYRVRLPSGASLAVFFYDGPIARALAFEGGLASSEELLRRLEGGFHAERGHVELLNVAVDGETFGHHRKQGEEVLAGALARAVERGIVLTNYGEFLERHPPTWEAQLVEPSSWSCAHGVERWRSDCGCQASGRPGWHQRWRGPLRAALDRLRDALAVQHEREGGRLFADPWAARDAYVELLLDREPERVEAFLAKHAARPGRLSGEAERRRALQLLELQRHAMLMYTSCGWFFSELSGLETVQVLRYAARALQLARAAGGPELEERFLQDLRRAPSNLPEWSDGRAVYERQVRPSMASVPQLVAHHAVLRLLDEPAPARLFGHRIEERALRQDRSGEVSLVVGRARLVSDATREAHEASFAALHLGGGELRCAVRPSPGPELHAQAEEALFAALGRGSIAEVLHELTHRFSGRALGPRDLLAVTRRVAAERLLAAAAEAHEPAQRRLVADNRRLLRTVEELGAQAPDALRLAAESVHRAEVRDLLDELREEAVGTSAALVRARGLLAEARALGVRGASPAARATIGRLVTSRLRRLLERPEPELSREAVELVALGELLTDGLHLWDAQNLFWQLLVDAGRRRPEPAALFELGAALYFDRRAIEARLRDATRTSRAPEDAA